MTKHRQIFESLRDRIASGKYTAADRLPSEAELARRFGVSRPTAARALRDLQQLGLLERKVGSGTYLRSGPPADTRTLSAGLLVPGLGNTEILDPICNEITRAGQARNMNVLWGDASSPANTADDALAICQQYINQKVDGVFFAPLENAFDREAVNLRIAETLQKAGIAVVLLDRDVSDFPKRSHFDLVGIDNFQSAFVLTNHLIEIGCKTFRFLARPGYPSTTDLRLAGCREAIARSTVGKNQPLKADFGNPAELDFVRSILRGKPDVIVCANDLTAALLIQTLSNLGVQLPDEVRVVGFDDVRYATLLSVPLTTIRQPCEHIGQAAVNAMLERLANHKMAPRQILLNGELIVRKSCGSSK